VLVVEDDPSVCEVVSRALAVAGYAVDQAADSSKATRLCVETPPDVMVMDVMLPGADGFSVVDGLRRLGVRRPALYTTALDLDRRRLDWIEAHGDRQVRKPFALRDLLDRVAALARLGRDS
jgi:two-component system OmpR family response regulator